MRRLIIHAGFPKTGTTALQARLRHNERILSESGILYPESKNNAHHRPAAALVGRVIGWDKNKRSSDEWQDFVEWIKSRDEECILISSEFFTAAKLKALKQLKNDLADFKIDIVFTLRSLDEIVPSIFQQNLKKGATQTYPEWLSKKFISKSGELLKKPKLINHSAVISQWVSIFGAQNVTLIMADSSRPETLFSHFEEYLGVSGFKDSEKRLNRSLTITESEIIRRINLAIKSKWSWSDYHKFMRQGYIKKITNLPSVSKEKYQTPTFLQPIISDFAQEQISVINQFNINVLGDISSFARMRVQTSAVPALNETLIENEVNSALTDLNRDRKKYNSWRAKVFRLLRRIIHK